MIPRTRTGAVALVLVLLCGCGAADFLRGRDATDDHDMSALMYAAAAGDSVEVERLLDDGANLHQTVRPHHGLRVFIAFISWMQALPDRDPGYSALHYALANNHFGIVRALLAHGALMPSGDESAWTLAQMKGSEGIRLLLDGGLTPDSTAGVAVMLATSARDTTSLGLLLRAGADPDPVRQGVTPLMVAARTGDEPTVRMLLAAGARPNMKEEGTGWTPAMMARDAGHSAIADLIGGPEDQAKLRNAELGRAVMNQDAARVAELLANGADPNTRVRMYDRVLSLTVHHTDHTIAELLLDAGADPNATTVADVTVLMEAVQRGDSTLVARMLAAGGNARAPGLASAAAAAGSLPLLHLLVESGANAREHQDQPLRSAVGRNGSVDVVRFLLEKGASAHAVDSNGRDAFGIAVAFGDTLIVRTLLDAGADPNRTMDRWTPLMSAAMSGDSALAQMLLDAGANPHTRNDEGRDAAEVARRAGHGEVAAWLTRVASGAR